VILPTIYDATLDGIAVDAKIGTAVVSASERIAIDEAPTVTVSVLDPSKALLRASLWTEPRDAPLTMRLGDRSYGLVQVDKQDARQLRLVFEQIEVLKLRAQQGFIKAYRSRTTRLAFCERLCREAGVDFHAPESGPAAPEFQPSSGSAVQQGGGFEKGAGVTVKGAPASTAQLTAIEAVLGEAFGEHAPERAVIAVVMCVTQESTWNPKAGLSAAAGDLERGHLGLFQQSPRFYPNPLDPVIATREFLKRFLPTYRANLGSTTTAHGLAALVESVQKSGLDPDATYARWYEEASRTVAAFARPGAHRTLLLHDKFEFSRGQPHRPETSWDALGRILSEIGWRRFMVGRTLWATSDEWLMATPARATLVEDTGAVETISWSLDVGKAIDRATVAVDDSWVYAPGVTVRLEDEGPASGKWLLSSWERDLLGVSGTLSLVKPGRTIPEPVGDQSGKGYKPQPPIDQPGLPTGPFPGKPLPGGNGKSWRMMGTQRAYPISERGTSLGGVAAHMSRPLGNWQSDNAVDLAAPPGTAVFACEAGTVEKVYLAHVDDHSSNIFGAQVTITCDRGRQFFYTHIRSVPPTIHAGALVRAGQQIGVVTEWAGTTHLHLGMAPPDNPEEYLRQFGGPF
jgi:murein DD-endopeptidase MepM/ murein hydrolase activator NlpD